MNAKKYESKVRRCLEIFKRDQPVVADTAAELKVLLLGNVGHTTCHDECSVLTELEQRAALDGVCSVAIIPGKQYSLVRYCESQQAETALLSLKQSSLVSPPIYASLLPKGVRDEHKCRFGAPPGLILMENFVSPDEEEQLLNLIRWEQEPTTDQLGCVLKHRSVRHFGYQFQYGRNYIDASQPLEDAPMPEVVKPLIQRMVSRGLVSQAPDQLTVNRYLPGQGIPPHIDSHSCSENLVTLSLGSDIVMDFSLQRDTEDISSVCSERTAVLLPRRSLCLFTGAARYCWRHCIKSRYTDVYPDEKGRLCLHHRCERVSFTFRNTRTTPCNCPYPKFCDYRTDKRNFTNTAPQLLSDPAKVEAQYVHTVYENIAAHFSETRNKPWPNVQQFICSLPSGSWLLDIGCGNGKYFGLHPDILQVGCDTSTQLLSITATRGHECLRSNCLSLPFRDHSFDAVICIAVLHHLASEQRRLESLRELCRVLRSGGEALVYVWAMDQCKNGNKSAYIKQNKQQVFEATDTKHELPVHVNRTNFVQQDLFVPWKLRQKQKQFEPQLVYHRYYHTFNEAELDSLCKQIKGVSICRSYYDEGNWCVRLIKN